MFGVGRLAVAILATVPGGVSHFECRARLCFNVIESSWVQLRWVRTFRQPPLVAELSRFFGRRRWAGVGNMPKMRVRNAENGVGEMTPICG